MDINEQDQSENDSEETSIEHSVDPDSSDSSDAFGEQELFPRVGDEYQAVIPDILTPSELLKYFGIPYDSQPMLDVSHKLLIGLPVLITWVDKEVTAIKNEAVEVHDEVDSFKADPKQCVTQISSTSDRKDSNVKGDYLDPKRLTNGRSAVPGLPADAWSEFEVDSFLLGLYIFGKNLLQVKSFMESKEMGQILSFYYGRFFRTDKHRRWADCRKIKGRKCIIGQRLLIGSRHQELFSRLLPRLSEESRSTSLEAYKAFTDGRISLEEYISKLKNVAGIQALVEAVAIGKVNKDLTAMAMEPSRTNHVFPSHGKACSDLTYAEIIKYLTGDIRLSKARSSDLFWEAVWPRLLAKGWHSEKPKDEAYRGSRNCLVFIVPGIKKFRRKLLKGGHYFDSVSDVLKKVASEPELLMLENEANGIRSSEKENGCGTEPTSDENGGSNHDHNRYLKPRFSSEGSNHMKFTVVDTSLFNGDEPSTVRELRSLPAKTKNSSAVVHRTRVAEECVRADEVGDPEKATDLSDKLKDFILYNHSKGQPRGGGKKRTAHSSFDQPQKPVKQPRHVKRDAEHQQTYAHSEGVDPVVKRRKLTACSKAEIKPIVEGTPKPLVVSQNNLVLKLPAPSEKPVSRSHSHAHTHNEVSLPTSSLVVDNHGEKGNKGDPNQGSCSSAISSESFEKPHPSIDLNKPLASAEPEVNEHVIDAKVEEANDSSQNSSNDTSTGLGSSGPVGGSTVDGFCSDEQANGNGRRHGTRIRPMSTKALEALESSFVTSKAAKKRSSTDSQDEKPRASRRARKKSSTPGICTVDAVRDTEAMRPSGIHNPAKGVLSDALT